MFERDYIKRIIKQFAEVVAKIILYKSQKDWQQTQMIVDVAAKQLLGLNPDLVENLDGDALISLFQVGGRTDHEKCVVLGRLLLEQAIIYEHSGAHEDKILKTYLKSFLLYATALEDPQFKNQENTQQVLISIENLLEFSLSTDTLKKLYIFLKGQNHYARAEDVIFLLLKQDPSFKDQAVSFYKDLLAVDDAELERGNLPRDEILEGLQRIEKLR